jgi:hypothetical protein
MLPLALWSQTDFNTRYFTITAKSLPEVDALSSFDFNTTPFVKRSLKEFQMNAENYRQSVDMASVVNDDYARAPQNVNIKAIESKYYNFGNSSGYVTDGTTRVKNTVYKEMRGLSFVDACPPFGICPRCAPYRVGQGY